MSVSLRKLAANYIDDKPGLSNDSRRRIRYNVGRWERFSPRDPADFRRGATIAGLAPASIETTIMDIAMIHAHAGLPFAKGKKLRMRRAFPRVHSLDELRRLSEHLPTAGWPQFTDPGKWWRNYFALACWTGLRLRDLRSITAAELRSGERVASKTGWRHPIHVPECITRDILDGSTSDTAPILTRITPKPFRRQLREACARAGIPQITCHGFRRFAITSWGMASTEAGRIVHGSGLGVMRHYYDLARILASAAERVAMPTPYCVTEQFAGQEVIATNGVVWRIDET